MEKRSNEVVVITYGTFDLFHIGHLNLLNNLKSLGTKLYVGVSTDDFNEQKGKKVVIPFSQRSEIVRNIKAVDYVFPEKSWDQKRSDITKYSADIFGMGSDWVGKFDFLSDVCKVVYLDRTKDISSTEIKNVFKKIDKSDFEEIKKALDMMGAFIKQFD